MGSIQAACSAVGYGETVNDTNNNVFSGDFNSNDNFDDEGDNSCGRDGDGLEGGRRR